MRSATVPMSLFKKLHSPRRARRELERYGMNEVEAMAVTRGVRL
jgi:hypothetical protein